ncbi:DMT family transporter [Dokdonella fugitiva]|uniref:Threonine/homoserine efflux transporter RhtA n=1 Tax=Dokdonella fugitiva TaxID=328517 RepID=A0A4R2I9P4_9GAMM|nr:EamA family transporter [Dokdonella fugitiva]MBA8885125.1 drug/metabolite transporter (DMT)-like permease [Dokdonella fugitiva]TCO41154.1 threonine/homoserine efflux transporter RhtA [Dokdonella fugitiva]
MTTVSSSRRPALVALALLTLVWSYNWIVMKQALRYSGPFEFSALRYVFGSVVLFAVLLLRGESLRPPPLWPTTLIGLAQTTGFQLFVQSALLAGGAGRTALLAYTMPFWVVLIGWLALGDRPTRRLWLGLAVAAAGLALVLDPWHGLGSAGSSALALAGGACWAIGVVGSKRLFQRGGTSALSLTAWQMLIGTLAVVVIALVVPERPIEWSNWFIGALVYNALLASGLAWLLWSYVVERLPANVAGLSSLVIPIAGVGFAWLVLGERPTLTEGTGIVLIAAALALVNLRRGG